MIIIAPRSLAIIASKYAKALNIQEEEVTIVIERSSLDYAEGMCFHVEDEVHIELDKRYNDIYLALAHEMVHAAQYINGRLQEVDGGVLWESKFYPSNKGACRADYLEYPWEKEAFSLEKELYNRR